ncbi:Ribosomal RNA-processing protein 7 [Tolypocladium capitatum]|uniref:Ribosomal RNA-processing protein 7 n=1 Tax=Tolypocladium capitatum TaxID=45235 RepID=A0A2K3QC32_9HYPO|nr:Ribosomal RNA-processing protein 7 [Tolypocladium capitatum]
MVSVKGVSDQFAILPIRMPPVPSFPQPAIHEVRIRRNAPKIPTPNDSRSLFLKNVPTDSTEPHFRAVFADLVGAGRFETIVFDDEAKTALPVDPAHATKVIALARKRKRAEVEMEERAREEEVMRLPEIWTRRLHRSSGTAIVLLADEKSAQLVLKAIAKVQKTKKYPVWGNNLADEVPPLGSPWVSAHLQLCRVDKTSTQTAVHAFFNAFNRKEKDSVELAKKLRNEPDEDGFVTVTRGGRAAPASRNEAEEAKQRMVDKQERRKSEMKDFYRFQLRERRKQEQFALLKRFQEDRRKVDAMREKRGKFRPET